MIFHETGSIVLFLPSFLIHFLKKPEFFFRSRCQAVNLPLAWYICSKRACSPTHDLFQHLSSVLSCGCCIEKTSLNDLGINAHLLFCTFQNNLLNRSNTNQHKNPHLLLLTNTMCPILCLLIHLWVPIAVKNDDGICCL
uniref:Uncharacterized protein n=1 Tax=Opuntia streptacantha TaxID=393608 RepID=A0A7C9EVE4_OPUST